VGLNKLTCPYISKMEHCCECSHAFYIPREHIEENTHNEVSPETKFDTEQK
jgi:hypothetical protein